MKNDIILVIKRLIWLVVVLIFASAMMTMEPVSVAEQFADGLTETQIRLVLVGVVLFFAACLMGLRIGGRLLERELKLERELELAKARTSSRSEIR